MNDTNMKTRHWLMVLLAAGAFLLSGERKSIADAPPRSLDERIEIELFAEAPDIVTPIGVVVDRQGRVLVVESHTHFRPEGYEGPAVDRIRAFEDTIGDGKADRITTFFEGSEQTMSTALAEDGSLYVATRREVFQLHDDNEDGAADRQTQIAVLKTDGNYPHNGLSGLVLDGFGHVYFSLGENLGATYELVGSDGTTLGGGGEGGSIFRCHTDGTELQRFATGFWNTFSLTFDAFGNLFAVDNDPDSRPPCRLLHVVRGGDYGYRFRNGRTGLHPFTAWNGELPGALPMVSGVGDAPSGVLAYEFGGLPADFQGDLLVTSAWIHHRIERHRIDRTGASFRSTPEVLIQGNDRFRPIGIAAAPDGSLYVTDWVDPSYNVHRQGRIWHIRSREETHASDEPDDVDLIAALNSPDIRVRKRAASQLAQDADQGDLLVASLQESKNDRARVAAAEAMLASGSSQLSAVREAMLKDESDEVRAAIVRQLPDGDTNWIDVAKDDSSPVVQAAALRRAVLAADDERFADVLEMLSSEDPFVRQAARDVLVRSPQVLASVDLEVLQGDQLAGILLVARSVQLDRVEAKLGSLLKHDNEKVRFIATQWIGEEGLHEFRTALNERLTVSETTGALLKPTLTALALLDGASPKDAERGGDKYLAAVLGRAELPDSVRVEVLRQLPATHEVFDADFLQELLSSGNEAIQIEAVRVLRESKLANRDELLSLVAFDNARPTAARVEAIVGLSAETTSQVEQLVRLVGDRDAPIRHEALRSLYGASLNAEQRQTLLGASTQAGEEGLLVRRLIEPDQASAVDALVDVDQRLGAIPNSGDANLGQRIFFHPRLAACGRCHRVAGRGATVGPELTLVARSMDRRKLLETVLQPSREIAPHYQTWAIETRDGQSLVGMLLRRSGYKGIYSDRDGRTFELADDDIDVLVPQPLSIMPEGLLDKLTPEEVSALLAYLSQRR